MSATVKYALLFTVDMLVMVVLVGTAILVTHSVDSRLVKADNFVLDKDAWICAKRGQIHKANHAVYNPAISAGEQYYDCVTYIRNPD